MSGWLYVSELEMTSREIEKRIAEDVIAGHNVLTGIKDFG
jgi:hypothetical protein